LGLAALAAVLTAVLLTSPWRSEHQVEEQARPAPIAEGIPQVVPEVQPASPSIEAVEEVLPDVGPVQTTPAQATEESATVTAGNSVPQPAADKSDELSPSLGGAQAIQDLDLSKVPQIAAFALSTGGVIELKLTQYGDLTDDGKDEALVPVGSQGTFGPLAYFVVALDEGWPQVIWQRAGDGGPNGIVVQLREGALVATEGLYAPEDALCCPSRLRETYFAWDGEQFVVIETREVASTNQKTGQE
jgi:hypothetical protein